jgi:NAD-dependent deacetylase
MVVYPAAGLINYVPKKVPKFIVDPNIPAVSGFNNLEFIADIASIGMEKVRQKILGDQ